MKRRWDFLPGMLGPESPRSYEHTVLRLGLRSMPTELVCTGLPDYPRMVDAQSHKPVERERGGTRHSLRVRGGIPRCRVAFIIARAPSLEGNLQLAMYVTVENI